jgi:hypothetical protein
MVFAPEPSEYYQWTALMRRGDFDEAWRISDDLLRRDPPSTLTGLPLHKRRVWNGEPLGGKRVLVRCNHGLGDTIQFSRYLPAVKAIARELHVAAQPALFELLTSMKCIDSFVDRDAPNRINYDVAVEVMELAHVFRTTVSSIPSLVPYLNVPQHPRKDIHRGPRIGLVWKSGDWDERRSVPFRMLLPLFDAANVEFHILQQEPKQAGWQEGCGQISPCRTVAETAASMLVLDLLISVDTMTAHLGGALGVTTWTLLQSRSDWRWLEETEKSPWYPTMRLFRQDDTESWKPVIDRVRDELDRFCA